MTQDIRSERLPGYRLAGLLGGRYDLTKLIAAGGMAEVFEARDSVLDRRVAVKILHATYGADAEFVERFRREAMAAGKLNHANIVQVYDWGRSEDGAAYMVMELVEGRTLRQVLTEHGALEPAAAARVGQRVCAALEVARKAGIMHRDIKPENILVDTEGRVKVADFGVARALAESRTTQVGVLLGTASYLAPEQVEGKPGDHRSDLYSLGIVLYELLTATTPFTGDNPVVVAYRRVAEDVPQLRSVRADVSPALERIVARATARRPEDRFASAAEMGAELAPLAVGGTLPASKHAPNSNATQVIPIGAPAINPASTPTTVIRQRVKPKRARRMLRLALVLLVALAMIPVGIRFLGTVAIPDVRGSSQEAATRSIEQAGLEAAPVLKYNAAVPQGSVILLQPAAGAKVRRGTKITMFVSLGPLSVTVPDVNGKTEAEAIRLLEENRLVAKVRRLNHSTPKGLVFFQSPAANLTLKERTTVTITVSNGPEQVIVPSVVGMKVAEAKQLIEEAGFTAVIKRVDSNLPRDQVAFTTPASGTKVDKGSAITLTVSNGPKEFPMPDVRGDSYADASRTLQAVGLKPVRRQVQGASGDTVVSQIPNAGRKVKRGDTVLLYTA